MLLSCTQKLNFLAEPRLIFNFLLYSTNCMWIIMFKKIFSHNHMLTYCSYFFMISFVIFFKSSLQSHFARPAFSALERSFHCIDKCSSLGCGRCISGSNPGIRPGNVNLGPVLVEINVVVATENLQRTLLQHIFNTLQIT